MFIGLLISFIMSFCRIFSHDYSNKNYQVKNIFTLSMTAGVSILFIFQYFIDYETKSFLINKFEFLSNPVLYLMLILNFLSHYVMRDFIKSNEKNLIYIQFSNFIFIALVPIFSVLSLYLFDFSEAINVKYESIWELILYSSILLFLAFCLFYDKVKNKNLNRPDLMFASIISSVFAFVLLNKLMQTYNTEAVYFCTMFFNSFLWLFFAHKNNEFKNVEKRHYKMFILFSFIYVFHSYLNIIIVNYLPSEHIAVFRTLAATLVAVIFDSIKFRKIKMKMKDFFVLVIIFFVLFMLDF
jgi:hypothetical protein